MYENQRKLTAYVGDVSLLYWNLRSKNGIVLIIKEPHCEQDEEWKGMFWGRLESRKMHENKQAFILLYKIT